MTATDQHRRSSKRFQVRWRSGVVFDRASGRPVFHTQTQDLSSGGAAITTEYADLTGTEITLLLAQPQRNSDTAPKMVKVRARVVSSVQVDGKNAYRHGLSFIPSSDDGLAVLAKLLEEMSAEPVRAASAANAPPTPPPDPETFTTRLSRLKVMAYEKRATEAAPQAQDMLQQRVNDALQRSLAYFKDLADQLNVAKPAHGSRGYVIAGVPEFAGLGWADGYVHANTREISKGVKRYEQVGLYYKLMGNKPVKVVREFPTSEKLKQTLVEFKIEFDKDEKRNDRGSVVQTTFLFPCEVKASLVLSGNFDTGKLLLSMRNVEHFGSMDYVIAPEAIDDASLDELAGFILGESNRIGPLLLKGA